MRHHIHAVYMSHKGDWTGNPCYAVSSPHSLYSFAPLALLQSLGWEIRLLFRSLIVKVNNRSIVVLACSKIEGLPKAISVPWLVQTFMLPGGWSRLSWSPDFSSSDTVTLTFLFSWNIQPYWLDCDVIWCRYPWCSEDESWLLWWYPDFSSSTTSRSTTDFVKLWSVYFKTDFPISLGDANV